MKAAITLILLMTMHGATAQDGSTIKINTLEQVSKLNGSGFLNPSFINGIIFFKDGTTGEAKLNFNRLTNQVLFISPKDDTLAIAYPESVAWVEIGTDSLYFFNDLVLQKVTHNKIAPDLYQRQNLKYIGKEKKGAYGTYSSAGSINSVSSLSNPGELTGRLSADENVIYKVETYFYLSDINHNFYPARKAQLFNAFPKYEKEISAFIKTHATNFNKKEDLLLVIHYIQSLY